MNRMEEEGYSVYRDKLNIIVETNENKKSSQFDLQIQGYFANMSDRESVATCWLKNHLDYCVKMVFIFYKKSSNRVRTRAYQKM